MRQCIAPADCNWIRLLLLHSGRQLQFRCTTRLRPLYIQSEFIISQVIEVKLRTDKTPCLCWLGNICIKFGIAHLHISRPSLEDCRSKRYLQVGRHWQLNNPLTPCQLAAPRLSITRQLIAIPVLYMHTVWRHPGPKLVASNVGPSSEVVSTGGRNRKLPIGGLANGRATKTQLYFYHSRSNWCQGLTPKELDFRSGEISPSYYRST